MAESACARPGAGCRMSTISYPTAAFADRDVEAALDAIAAAGFEQAEILGEVPHVAVPLRGEALAGFRRRLESRGLTASVHAPMRENVPGAPDEQGL